MNDMLKVMNTDKIQHNACQKHWFVPSQLDFTEKLAKSLDAAYVLG